MIQCSFINIWSFFQIFKCNILEWSRLVFAQYVDFTQVLTIVQTIPAHDSQLCKSPQKGKVTVSARAGIYDPSGINDQLIAPIPASMWRLPGPFLGFGQNLNIFVVVDILLKP